MCKHAFLFIYDHFREEDGKPENGAKSLSNERCDVPNVLNSFPAPGAPAIPSLPLSFLTQVLSPSACGQESDIVIMNSILCMLESFPAVFARGLIHDAA